MTPIAIIPWDRDFLAGLVSHVVERFEGRFENLVILFPHRRPKRYLVDKLQADSRLAKPCLLPNILSIGDLFADLCQRVHRKPLRQLGELDQVGLLHRVVSSLRPGLRGDTDGFPAEVKDFFPWGLRLSRLMDELFQQRVTAADLEHLQDQVLPTAATLLGNLRSIQAAYRQALLDEGAATPGLMHALVAENATQAVEALRGKLILACGFYALTGSEEALLKPLWKSGRAEILWHTDPDVARAGASPHWSCREHSQWLTGWKAKATVLTDEKRSPLPTWRKRGDQLSLFSAAPAPPPPRRAAITFHQGFDLHSQLKALREELDKAGDTAGYAVVLPDTNMLMPVLHHLPRRDVNISMGFPLTRSPLFQLVDLLLRLQDDRRPQGYHWRQVIGCLRHPLLKFLEVDGQQPLRLVFHAWEEAIRKGEKYLDPASWTPAEDLFTGVEGREAVEALLRRVVAVCFTAFEEVSTPRAMAQALLGLASLLLDPDHGGGHWERFVIDAQCLARLMDVVIPELHDSSISNEPFPPEAVRTMARELVKRQRVPFEADPLAGLQVLGMLETRLLTFERVFILGATEDVLPGAPKPDVLLPDPLRQSLGLPDQRHGDLVAAHTFYRLIQGAREVGLFTSSGIQPGLLDGKSMPSRYVEQLIWEEEKRQGRLLGASDAPRRLISLPMRGVLPPSPAVANTHACRMRVQTLLRYRSLSPTFLDDYIKCPLRFFYKYVTPLAPLDEVAESGDPPALGQLIHEVLQDFFRPRLNQFLDPTTVEAEPLLKAFEHRLETAPFFRQMPPDARLMLQRTGRHRLSAFVAAMVPTTPLELETRLETPFSLGGETYKLRGDVDRVDRREDGLWVLDYKTGGQRKPKPKFWDDETLWDWIECQNPAEDTSLLPKLAASLESIQLPLYLYLYKQKTGLLPVNGAFVALGTGGQEVPLLGAKVDAGLKERYILEQVPALVGCILRLILGSQEFVPTPSRSCEWCPYATACGLKPV